MPKRGQSQEFISSDEDSSSGSNEDKPKKKKTRQEKVKKPAAAGKGDDSRAGSKGDSKDADDELMQLSKMRFVSVSSFKGRALVNIREYYDKDGKLLPGRKGISLSIDQWQRLKECMDDIDERVRKIV